MCGLYVAAATCGTKLISMLSGGASDLCCTGILGTHFLNCGHVLFTHVIACSFAECTLLSLGTIHSLPTVSIVLGKLLKIATVISSDLSVG